MKHWHWKTYAVLAAIALGVFWGRVSVGNFDAITGLALFASVIQGANAYIQWSRPR